MNDRRAFLNDRLSPSGSAGALVRCVGTKFIGADFDGSLNTPGANEYSRLDRECLDRTTRGRRNIRRRNAGIYRNRRALVIDYDRAIYHHGLLKINSLLSRGQYHNA